MCIVLLCPESHFLHVKAATTLAHLSHRNSIRPSVTEVDQSKMVQASFTKSSQSAAWKALVSGPIKPFHKFEGVTPNEGAK